MNGMEQVTRFECPIESCTWGFADPGPSPVLHDVAPGEPAAVAHATRVDRIIRQHLETHTIEEWVQEVTRLRTALDEATAENEPAEWRARIEVTLLSIQSRLNEIPPAR